MAFLSPLQEMRVDVNVIVYQRVVLQLWLKSTSEDAKVRDISETSILDKGFKSAYLRYHFGVNS